jgi:hypothetical protein
MIGLFNPDKLRDSKDTTAPRLFFDLNQDLSGFVREWSFSRDALPGKNTGAGWIQYHPGSLYIIVTLRIPVDKVIATDDDHMTLRRVEVEGP